MSSLTFSHSVFKRLVLKIRENQGLFWKGLIEFVEKILNGSEILAFPFDQAENIAGKGENTDYDYQHFLLS